MRRLILLVTVVFVFVVVSGVLARGFGAGGVERTLVTDVARDLAAGRGEDVLTRMPGCRSQPACATRVRGLALRATRPGRFQILNISGQTKLALGSDTRVVRVAWKGGGSLPVVECMTVHRNGSLLRGFDVALRALRGIVPEGDC